MYRQQPLAHPILTIPLLEIRLQRAVYGLLGTYRLLDALAARLRQPGLERLGLGRGDGLVVSSCLCCAGISTRTFVLPIRSPEFGVSVSAAVPATGAHSRSKLHRNLRRHRGEKDIWRPNRKVSYLQKLLAHQPFHHRPRPRHVFEHCKMPDSGAIRREWPRARI